MVKLWDNQNAALQELRQAVGQGCRRIVMQAPTGFGKTVLSAALVESARAKNKKVIFTVPVIDLIDQTVSRFHQHGIDDVGVIQADHQMTDWSQPIQVASVQTLQRRTIPDADVCLIDEVHKWFGFYEQWLRDPKWQDTPIIGLSATPWTKGLGAYFDKLIIADTTQNLIDQKLLSPFRVFAPSHPDLKGIKTVGGDYQERELSKRMQETKLVADIVETWLKHGRGRPTLCFAVDRLHAKHLQKQFQDRGVSCDYQDAYTSINERAAIQRRFHAGETEIVVNIGTLTTGVDWDVRCILMCRPTKSEMLFVQIVGRGLRTAPGKEDCLILDHSDNHLRLGFVTDIDVAHEGLHNGQTRGPIEKTDRINLPKECPQCSYLKPPKVSKCPNCGFTTVAQAKVNVKEGELKELKKRKKQQVLGNKADVYRQLLWICKQRGYKSGWADNKYRELFSIWPKGMRFLAPMPPTPDLLSWIKREQINYSRRRNYAQRRDPAKREKRDAEIIERVKQQFVPGTLLTEDDANFEWR